MLILARQPGQIITTQPREGLLPETTVGRLIADGPMEIVAARVRGNNVCLGIQAHPELLVTSGNGTTPYLSAQQTEK